MEKFLEQHDKNLKPHDRERIQKFPSIEAALKEGVLYVDARAITRALRLNAEWNECDTAITKAWVVYQNAKERELEKPEWRSANSPSWEDLKKRMAPAWAVYLEVETAAAAKLIKAILDHLEKQA